MVYGETGRYPIHINMKLKILNFWTKLLMNSNLCEHEITVDYVSVRSNMYKIQ